MKTAKKSMLSFLLALFLCLTCCLPATAATEEDGAHLKVTPSATAVRPGDTFTLTVALENNPGLWALMFTMQIDQSAFTYIGCNTEGTIFPESGAISGMVESTPGLFKCNRTNGSNTTNMTADGTLVTITLQAKTEASLQAYTFTAAVDAANTIQATTSGSKTMPVADASSTVTVRNLSSAITQAQVSLGSDITVHYYATLSTAHEGATMQFTMNGKTTNIAAVATETPGLYRFPFEKVAPQCMGDAISATLLYGTEVLDQKTGFSVRQYCDTAVASTAAALGISEAKKACLNTLSAELLAYGAQAQIYRGYKTDALANADFAVAGGSFKELSSSEWEYYLEGSATDTCAMIGAGVYYGNTNALYIRFLAKGYTEENFSIEVKKGEEGEAKVYHLSDATDLGEGEYVLVGEPISALNFADYYTISLCTTNKFNKKTEVQTLYYGVNYYVYSMQAETGADGTLTPMALLARATYQYGAAAKAYAAAV